MSERSISNYRLVRRLGVGGMGAVYLGEHHVIDRKVAIKLLLPELCGDEELIGRFFNEARAAATAKHPGIVEILDVGYHEDQAFITMEYIEGVTLAKFVRERNRLSEQQALSLTHQIAGALGAAHDRGIVHRDLKPNNVMVVTDPVHGRLQTKVFDFGIAKLFGENSSGTRTGVVIGTPLYMSPEQCKGAAEVDHRSDLYSLGCLLYFMLTGRRVFEVEGDGDIIAHHIMVEPTPPSEHAPVSPALSALTMKLLAKDPNDRYQSTNELLLALEEELASSFDRAQAEVPASESGPMPRETSVALAPQTPHSRGSSASLSAQHDISPLPVSAIPVPQQPVPYAAPSSSSQLPVATLQGQGVVSASPSQPAMQYAQENTPGAVPMHGHQEQAVYAPPTPISQLSASHPSVSQPASPVSLPATPMSVSNFIRPEGSASSKLRWAVPAACVAAIALVVVLSTGKGDPGQPATKPVPASATGVEQLESAETEAAGAETTETESTGSASTEASNEMEEVETAEKAELVEPEAEKSEESESEKAAQKEAKNPSEELLAPSGDTVGEDDKPTKKHSKKGKSGNSSKGRDNDALKPTTLDPFRDK